MPTFLILTVGTGTSGRYSNLAQGLINTIHQQKPDAYWLMPSASPDSTTIADLVREEIPNTFHPWSPSEPYRTIAHHDSIADCRDSVREVIRAVRTSAPDDIRLLVNPTSGTKQMSAGATLAALDESVAGLEFTVGERSDGVVKTGTERIEHFDPGQIFAERDHALAIELTQAGAFLAAWQLLRLHPSLAHEADTALCLHEWDRLNYEAARQIAARSSAPALASVRSHLQALSQSVGDARPPSPIVISDLLHTSEIFHTRGDSETSLFHACKALEMGLRLAFYRNTQLADPYPLETVCALPISDEMRSRLRKNSRDQRTVILGLQQVAEILEALGDPLGTDYLANAGIKKLVNVRNKMAHAIQPVSPEQSQTMIGRVRLLLAPLRLPDPPPRPVLRR